MEPYALYVASVLLSFAGVFLKGFQLKNVMGKHIKSLAMVSYLIAAFEVATVSIIVKGGWMIALTAGTGGALGMITSLYVHDRLFKGKK